MAFAGVFTPSGGRSGGGGVSPSAGSTKWPPYSTKLWWYVWVHTFAYVKWWFDWFLSMLPLYGFLQPRGSALKRGIIQWHCCMWCVQGRVTPALCIVGSPQPQISSDNCTFILLYSMDIPVCNHIYRYIFLQSHPEAYPFTLCVLRFW
jgi:hypothetical protein